MLEHPDVTEIRRTGCLKEYKPIYDNEYEVEEVYPHINK